MGKPVREQALGETRTEIHVAPGRGHDDRAIERLPPLQLSLGAQGDLVPQTLVLRRQIELRETFDNRVVAG